MYGSVLEAFLRIKYNVADSCMRTCAKEDKPFACNVHSNVSLIKNILEIMSANESTR